MSLALGLGLLLAAGATLRAEEKASAVVVATVERKPVVETIQLAGTVTAERRASLSARTAGLVKAVHVDAGSRVKQGDVLLELDPALAQLALQRAEASLGEARATLEERKRLYEEIEELTKSGGIPRTELEARRAAFRTQEAVTVQAEVAVQESREIVERHQLLAPFGGMINGKMSEVGEWVETGTPVLDLVEVDVLRFDLQAPQERYAEMQQPGTEVSVRLDTAPQQEFPARVLTTVPVKDPQARTFLVRLRVEAPEGTMTPGTSGQASLKLSKAETGLIVPRDAIVRQPDGGTLVWVLTDNGTGVRPQPVQIGSRMAEEVEVRQGLKEGEQVVTRGNETLREGQKVRIVPHPEATAESGAKPGEEA